MHPAKNLTAFAADDYLSKDVVAAESSGLSVWACVYNTAADKLFLHLHENFTRDNGLMVIFYIVLRNNAVVLNAFLCKKVNGISFLQKSIPNIFFVSQDVVYIAGMPSFIACSV
mgnify:CR=1 FL=1